jgi:hypothetical protein
MSAGGGRNGRLSVLIAREREFGKGGLVSDNGLLEAPVARLRIVNRLVLPMMRIGPEFESTPDEVKTGPGFR